MAVMILRTGCALMYAGVLAASSAMGQTCRAEVAGGAHIESERYLLAFRTEPATPVVGSHFSVDFAVCAHPGQPLPESVRVDGYMPDHRHGMNYRPTVKVLAGGRYLAEGLMFHMPGRWDLIFEVRGDGKTDRVAHRIVLD